MQKLIAYFICINLITFILTGINARLHAKTDGKQINKIVAAAALLGGSLGMILSILIFDRKAHKENMMSHVFAICIFIIHLILYLILSGVHGEQITFAFWTFFADHKLLPVYLGIINIVTFVVFAIDKRKAIRQKPRIKIVTLLLLCFAGGSLGGLIGMYLLRHKTQKNYFTVGVPLIMVMQSVLIFFIMNL